MSARAVLLLFISCFPVFLLFCFSAEAQLLQADWIDENNRRIADARQTAVRVIVLDEKGVAQAGVPVQIQQISRDLPIGFTIGRDGFEGLDLDQPVWRVFNAVALDRVTRWAITQPTPDVREDLTPAMWIVDEAQRRGMTVRWGGIVSADPAQNPDWLLGLTDRLLEQLLDLHVAEVLEDFGPRVGQFDIYTDNLSHRFIEDRLGHAMVRRLYERSKAIAPHAAMCMRFNDSLTGQRLPAMVRAVTAMREDFIPADLIAIEQRIEGKVNRTPLRRALEWIGRLGMGVVLVDLEVGGGSDAAAAVNLETLFRVVMADPNVQGVWMGPIHAGDVTDPAAALLDADGRPTALGELFDRLFTELWRTDELLKTDELGNAQTPVFAGAHQITALLPDGRAIETTVWVPRDDEVRVIILQPLAPAAR